MSASYQSSNQSREITWEQWQQDQDNLLAWRDESLGRSLSVVLKTADAASASQFDSLLSVDRIVVDVEVLTDGRIFGIGRHLREHGDYRGLLEARGDYLPDQIAFLEQCGFNRFASRAEAADKPPEFSAKYQKTRRVAQSIREKRLSA